MYRGVCMDVIRYLRVSTDEQNTQRQFDATKEYSQREFGTSGEVFADRSTGTDTERGEYQAMMDQIESGNADAVVVHEVSRISRSIRDLDRTVDRLDDAGVELHIISEGLKLKPRDSDPYQKALLQLLGVFAELEAEMTRKRVKEGISARMETDEYHHGPAPLGFEKDDGRLIEGDGYDRVCSVLEMVQKGELSKRKAAGELDTSRKTIDRSLERSGMYGV